MFKNISLKVSILQIFTTLLLITVAVISYNFYDKSSEALLKLSDQVTKEVTDKVIERVTNYLDAPAIQIKAVSRLVNNPNIMEIHREMWEYMWQQLMVMPHLQSIFLADTQGNYVQVRREPRLATRCIDRRIDPPVETWLFRDENYEVVEKKIKTPDFDPRRRPWFKNTKPEYKNYWTDVYVSTTAQTPVIAPSYPVIDKNGDVAVVVCTNSPLHSLSDFVAQQKVSQNGIVFIINGKDEIMAYPDASFTTRKDEKTGKLRLVYVDELEEKWIVDVHSKYKELKKRKFFAESDGVRYIANYVPFPRSFDSKWQIVVIIPENDILGSVKKMSCQAVMIALAILLLSFVAVYFAANRITRPITDLIQDTTQIKNFQLDKVNGVKSNIKEISQLSDAILTATRGLQSFRKYVPADLVQQLIQLGREADIGGEKKELTILFSDIAGFTAISEKMKPEKLMQHLSEYLETLSDIIMQEKGTIDKYIGDAIMAFWGAPIEISDSPLRACRAALSCQKKIEELNQQWTLAGKPAMPTRIGINTGPTVVGNIGSDIRMNYTIMGDTVNLASRLEGINKLYGTKIIISEFTYQHIADEFICRLLDIVAVKGRSQGVKIYELIASKGESLSEKKIRLINEFEYGFNIYLQKDWLKAIEIFTEIQKEFPEDKATKQLLERCINLHVHFEKIPDDWDGTYMLATK
ncbi:MAG: hypothetical protein JW786_10735 [Desulfobacterales bacterium]|nr:hypothetical protein [Desulfobacterales bacterium]